MPKIAKGPYLKLRKQSGAKSIYYIIDNDSRKSTGFDAKQLPQAKQALEDHIRNRFIPKPSEDYYVQQALELYAHDVIPKHAKPIDATNHIARLMEFFRGHTCDAVDPHLTASYERWRTHIGKASVNEPKRTRQPVKPEVSPPRVGDPPGGVQPRLEMPPAEEPNSYQTANEKRIP